MNPHRRYLVWFGVTSLAMILGAGALNLLVDPYDRFGLNRLGTYITADREYKSTEFPRFAPEAVLLGNSRAAMISVSGLHQYRFFNAAIAGAEVEEIRSFVQRYVKNQKLVVIGLDLFSFGPLEKQIEDPLQPLTARRALEYILSLKNVEYSVRTIASALSGKPRDYSPDGSFHEANWSNKADNADAEATRRKQHELATQWASYKFDPARLQALRDIRDTLAARHIPLLVYLAPQNAAVWEELKGTSGYAEMLRTRDAILQIFPQAVDLTVSEYSAPEGFFRGDPMHFRSAVGERFLQERVLPAKP